MSTDDDSKKNRITREEIEVLCILSAIGRLGVTSVELTERLGISTTLSPMVMECVQSLPGDDGWIETEGDRFTLTAGGSRHLGERLKTLGITAPRAW